MFALLDELFHALYVSPLENALLLLATLAGSGGVAIILLTVAVRAILLPLGLNAPRANSLRPFLQVPVLFGLHLALRDLQSAHGAGLFHEGFLWVDNLARPDTLPLHELPGLSGLPLPADSHFPGLLSLLATGCEWAMGLAARNDRPRSPSERFKLVAAPLVLLSLTSKVPAGIVLYWVTSNLFAAVLLPWEKGKTGSEEAG